MSEPIVMVKNLKKKYGNKEALSGVTMSIEKGEILGLVGPNGAGKTTFLKLLMRLIKPTEGSIKVFNKEHKNLSEEDWRKIGYIAEEPILYDFMTANEIIKFNRRFFPSWDEERCEKMLARLNIDLEEKIKNYSRGMISQLSLILVLMHMPDLLMLDEPLEGLDPLRRIEFLNIILEEYMEQEGRTIIISSHALSDLERMADRVAFLNNGRLIKISPMEKLRGEEKTIRVVFQKEPPQEFFTMEGIKGVQKEGKMGFIIRVEENFAAIYDACSRFPHFALDVYHRDLEDLFKDMEGRNNSEGF